MEFIITQIKLIIKSYDIVPEYKSFENTRFFL